MGTPVTLVSDASGLYKIPPNLLADSRKRRIQLGAGRIGSLALLLGIGALPLASKRDAPVESPYPKSAATQVDSMQYGLLKGRS